MKKILLLSFLAFVIAITGCKKDKIDGKPEKTILGKWFQKKIVETEYEDGKKVDEDVDTDFDNTDSYEFKDNGTVVDGDGEVSRYKVSGTTLTLTTSDGVQEYEIKKLTSSDLVIYGEHSEKEGNVTYKQTWEITFKK